MITNRMRRVLEDDLNYHEEEIDMMDPQIASVVIERGLARPLTGMPKSWHKIQPSKPMLSGIRESVTASSQKFKKVVNFAIYKVLPIAIPAAGFVYAVPKLFQILMQSYSSMKAAPNSSPLKARPLKRQKPELSRRLKTEIPKPVSVTRRKAGGVDVTDSKLNNRIDMRALNKINRPSSFLEKLIGK